MFMRRRTVFFFDLSGKVLLDDILAGLLTFPNVIITAHQAFLLEKRFRRLQGPQSKTSLTSK